jgi:hypothetical protein
MLKFDTMGQVKQFAIDRTPTFGSAMVSYSRPLNEHYQIMADATVTQLSGTPPSGGIDGTLPSGTEYYLSTQLLGTNLFKSGDMYTTALRYAALADSKVYFLDLNARYPITDDLRVSPRARIGYRTGTTTDLRELTLLPSLLIDYSLAKDLGLEAEIGYRYINSSLSGLKSETKDLYFTLGLRSDFSSDGTYKCAGILAPCVGMLSGSPNLEHDGAARDRAFYGPALYDKAIPNVTSAFTFESGLRYWYSTATNGYDYHADTTSASSVVSRLSYTSLKSNSGELFFRADARTGLIRNFFLKGTLGGGEISNGKLFDEDFPPVTAPYSKTESSTSGALRYGTLDLGYNLYTRERFRVGAFIGFHTWLESVGARGCVQLAGNPDICVPSVPGYLKLVNERDRWNAFRLGTVLDVNLTDRLKWNSEIALTTTSQHAQDDHYYTFGLAPASGHGGGFQAETMLKYAVTDNFSIGAGGRWWHQRSDAIDSFGQLLRYKTDRYGVFLQASYRLSGGKYSVESKEVAARTAASETSK